MNNENGFFHTEKKTYRYAIHKNFCNFTRGSGGGATDFEAPVDNLEPINFRVGP